MKMLHEGVETGIIVGSGIGLAMAAAKSVIEERHGGWLGWFRGAIAAVVVAIWLGWLLHSSALDEPFQWGIMAISAYAADDILLAFSRLTASVARDPKTFFTELLATWRRQR